MLCGEVRLRRPWHHGLLVHTLTAMTVELDPGRTLGMLQKVRYGTSGSQVRPRLLSRCIYLGVAQLEQPWAMPQQQLGKRCPTSAIVLLRAPGDPPRTFSQSEHSFEQIVHMYPAEEIIARPSLFYTALLAAARAKANRAPARSIRIEVPIKQSKD